MLVVILADINSCKKAVELIWLIKEFQSIRGDVGQGWSEKIDGSGRSIPNNPGYHDFLDGFIPELNFQDLTRRYL